MVMTGNEIAADTAAMGWLKQVAEEAEVSLYHIAENVFNMKPSQIYKMDKQTSVKFEYQCKLAELIGWNRLGEILDENFSDRA